MKTEEWRKVTLNDSRLRLIRTKSRVILMRTIQSELKRLRDLMNLYRDKRLEGKSTPSQFKRDKGLYREYYDLDYTYHHSVLLCSDVLQCRTLIMSKLSQNLATLALDMVWNPVEKFWICINCYNYYYKTDAQKQKYSEIQKKIVFDD